MILLRDVTTLAGARRRGGNQQCQLASVADFYSFRSVSSHFHCRLVDRRSQSPPPCASTLEVRLDASRKSRMRLITLSFPGKQLIVDDQGNSRFLIFSTQ